MSAKQLFTADSVSAPAWQMRCTRRSATSWPVLVHTPPSACAAQSLFISCSWASATRRTPSLHPFLPTSNLLRVFPWQVCLQRHVRHATHAPESFSNMSPWYLHWCCAISMKAKHAKVWTPMSPKFGAWIIFASCTAGNAWRRVGGSKQPAPRRSRICAWRLRSSAMPASPARPGSSAALWAARNDRPPLLPMHVSSLKSAGPRPTRCLRLRKTRRRAWALTLWGLLRVMATICRSSMHGSCDWAAMACCKTLCTGGFWHACDAQNKTASAQVCGVHAQGRDCCSEQQAGVWHIACLSSPWL